MNVPDWIEKNLWGFNTTQDCTGNQGKLHAGEVLFPQEVTHQLVVQYQMTGPEKYIHYTDSTAYVLEYMYIHVYMQ